MGKRIQSTQKRRGDKMTQSEHLNQIALNIAKQGRQQVIDNPNQFGLFTEQQVKELMYKARLDECKRYQNLTMHGNEKILSDFKQQNKIIND